MRKTTFLNFAANALAVHKSHSVAGEAVKQRLLAAGNYEKVIVTYCADSKYKYTVTFEVTETYIVVSRPPITVYLDKTALSNEDCQSHLYGVVRAALEV